MSMGTYLNDAILTDKFALCLESTIKQTIYILMALHISVFVVSDQYYSRAF